MSNASHPIILTLKRLKHRDGLFLKNIWSSHLVDNNDAILVQDILESLKDSLNLNKTEKERTLDEVTIPTAIINELNILIYKALVTGRSFLRDLSSGQHSYAEITAYNGCFFWARCILLILGVWISPKKVNESYWIIDIYPEKVKTINSRFNFIKIGNRQPGHIEIWLALKRIINSTTSKNLPVDTQFIAFINDIDESSIGFKRHNIQYSNNYWINIDDLKKDCIKVDDLSWVQEFDENIYAMLDLKECSSENSIIYFYLILARNFYFILKEIESELPEVFQIEINEIIQSFEFIEILLEKNWLKEIDNQLTF